MTSSTPSSYSPALASTSSAMAHETDASATRTEGTEPVQKKRKRVRKHSSCEPCRAKKIKCDRQMDCANCRLHQKSCYYVGAEPVSSSVDAGDALAAANAEIARLRVLVDLLSKGLVTSSPELYSSTHLSHAVSPDSSYSFPPHSTSASSTFPLPSSASSRSSSFSTDTPGSSVDFTPLIFPLTLPPPSAPTLSFDSLAPAWPPSDLAGFDVGLEHSLLETTGRENAEIAWSGGMVGASDGAWWEGFGAGF